MHWSAPEFHFQEKTAMWRTGSVILAVFLLLMALWQRNIMFGIFIILAESIVLLNANQKPRNITYEVTEEGIAIGEKEFYRHEEFLGFSIFNDPLLPQYHELLLRKVRSNGLGIEILVPDEVVESLQDALLNYMDELEHEESFLRHLTKRLKM